MTVRRLLITATSLMISSAAALAAVPVAEEAYEVRADAVTLPASEFGSIILRLCESCEPITLRVDGDTGYFYARSALPLPEFRKLMQDLPRAHDTAVTVLVRRGDRRVTRVLVPNSSARSRDYGQGR
jgi:hypothetical protein